jgi:hypothetical protein
MNLPSLMKSYQKYRDQRISGLLGSIPLWGSMSPHPYFDDFSTPDSVSLPDIDVLQRRVERIAVARQLSQRRHTFEYEIRFVDDSVITGGPFL